MQRPRPPREPQSVPRLPARTPRRSVEPAPRTSAAGAAGVVLALAVAAFVVLHGLTLAGTSDASSHTLHAVLPALTDLDQALTVHAEDIRTTASLGSATVPLPGLPLPVEVPLNAAEAGGAELRRAAVDSMARLVYDKGSRAFRAEDAKRGGAPGLFSSQWAVQRSLDAVSRDAHRRFALARTVAGSVAVVAAGLLMVQVDGRRRLAAVGSALVAGAVLAGLGAVVAWLLLWLVISGSGSVAEAVVFRVGRDLLLTVVLTAVVLAVSGVAQMMVGVVMTRWARRADGSGRSSTAPRGSRLAREPWEEL
jgi:hypothetical protein